jgi:hypothetical protein
MCSDNKFKAPVIFRVWDTGTNQLGVCLKQYLCRCSVSLPVCCASGRSIRDIRWWGDVCCDGVVGTAACVAAALASTV